MKMNGLLRARPIAGKILFWFLLNTVLGTIIASLMASGSPYPFLDIFISSQITTHAISSLSSMAGHVSGRIFYRPGIVRQLLLVLPWTFAASMAGYLISRFITRSVTGITPFPGGGEIQGTLIVAILSITLIITTISLTIQRLSRSRNDLLERIGRKRGDGESGGSLTVREKESHFVIDFLDIIYLSSHGKKTLIHTEARDYETPQLLKEIEERLDPGIFIRIHKQFIVNVKYILRVQYYQGGRYMAYLKDDDETMLPVGKSATAALKERLGI